MMDTKCFSYMVYGAQDLDGNFHKCCFDLPGMVNILRENGLKILKSELLHGNLCSDVKTTSNPNIRVVAQKIAA